MARMGVNTVVEGKIYQRGEFLKWTHDQKHEFLSDLGVDVVVNLWGKVDPDLSSNGLNVIYLSTAASSRGVPDASLMVAFVAGLIRAGHKVLVHCEAGVNRSAWFCARLIVELELGLPLDAWRMVEAAVPRAKLRPELWRDLILAVPVRAA